MKLSILVCTVPSRLTHFLPAIIQELDRQAAPFPDVEVCYFGDNKRRTVGAKRNAMLLLAQGDYVVFIDDDDKIAPNYVEKIYGAISQRPDVVCFGMTCSLNGGPALPVNYSAAHPCDANYPDHYDRIPDQKMVVRRDLALQVGFPNIQCGEDANYAARLRPLLKTEKLVPEILYNYIFSRYTTETQ